MPTPTPKKFPLGKVRELQKHVAGLHAHLANLIGDYDGSASDNSDADQPYAQAQDSAHSAMDASIKAAVAEALDRPPSTGQAMARILANSRINASR